MIGVGDIFIIILLSFICYLYISWIIRSGSNEKWKCLNCKVVSRRGIWDLYNSQIAHEQSYHKCCPICEELVKIEEVYINTPLAPSLNTIKCLKINMAISKNQDSMQADEQLASYLKIQNKKLEKMKAITKSKDQTQ